MASARMSFGAARLLKGASQQTSSFSTKKNRKKSPQLPEQHAYKGSPSSQPTHIPASKGEHARRPARRSASPKAGLPIPEERYLDVSGVDADCDDDDDEDSNDPLRPGQPSGDGLAPNKSQPGPKIRRLSFCSALTATSESYGRRTSLPLWRRRPSYVPAKTSGRTFF